MFGGIWQSILVCVIGILLQFRGVMGPRVIGLEERLLGSLLPQASGVGAKNVHLGASGTVVATAVGAEAALPDLPSLQLMG